MKKGFDEKMDEVLGGRKETLAGETFGCLCQVFGPYVLVEASTAFSRNDPGWRIVMSTRLSLPGRADNSKKRWHDVSGSSSAGMLGVMMRVTLTFESFARRILPPVPLDQ